MGKPDLAIDAHRKALKGTAFEKKCVPCPGCTGRLNVDGTMMCSNVGATLAPVTALQAQACKNGKPPNAVQKKKKRMHVHQSFDDYVRTQQSA